MGNAGEKRNSCYIANNCCKYISKCQRLKNVYMSFNSVLTDREAEYIADACPEVKF
jgi:hypothetical protein